VSRNPPRSGGFRIDVKKKLNFKSDLSNRKKGGDLKKRKWKRIRAVKRRGKTQGNGDVNETGAPEHPALRSFVGKTE